MDVPIATITGEGTPLIGSTTPFSAEVPASLYLTHRDYVRAFRRAAKRAVAEGFLLRRDARALIAEATASDIGE